MKIFARAGAIVSFIFFLLPGARLLNSAKPDDLFAFVLGSSLIGIAAFAGTMLWIVGEKSCPKRQQ